MFLLVSAVIFLVILLTLVSCRILGFNGPAFTWQRGGTFVRLDRALANDAWVSTFPEYSVHHLTRIKSDHRPLLLSTIPDLSISQGRTFRFLAGWTKHSDFSNLVKERWNFAGNMVESLNNFTFFAKDWNRNIYGFLGTRKRNIMRSLNNIQKTLEHSSSTYLAGKELEIRDVLENVLDHKDLLWRQKARCDWLQLGDQNTKFFYSRTLRRRKFNRIITLRIDNGEWCTDQDILQAKAVEYFEELFGEDSSTLRDIPNVGFPSFNSSEITFLKASITNEEIKRALFDMAPLKAPGSDGFHAYFFQSQWDILGNDVCQWVKDIFDRRLIEPELNNALIVLIPKKESLEDFSHFRPISLCSVLYKKGKKWMSIKLDLEKAYDRVSWDFISASLATAGIPVSLRKTPTQKFKPKRRIRQGCPLSPYLFVLCMEWLGHFIRTEIDSRKWDPIHLSRTGPLVSHLFFADDLVIFCKAQLDQARLLDSILTQFCEISGHQISVRKNNIFFSKDTEANVRNQINQLFGFQEVRNLGTYLVVPLLHERITKSTLSFIVDKSLMIPKSVSADIERLVRQFIWGSTDGHPKMSLVGWSSICQPRSLGGLGEMVNSDGSWNLDLFCARVLKNIINRIISIPPPHPDSGSDRIIWSQSASGIFSVRSAYWYLKENSWNSQDDYWKIVCKYLGPQRVRVFLWLAFKQKLLTNSERARRGISHYSSCSICGHDIEDLVHVLRDCPSAQDVWRLVIPYQLKQSCWGRHYTYHVGDYFNNKQGSSLMVNSDDNWVFLFTDGA
ncbi:hypothetical protein Goarm_005853, partial [Gossypium armourianum]|nr:hypothetical protein [Gossypium armourianum]